MSYALLSVERCAREPVSGSSQRPLLSQCAYRGNNSLPTTAMFEVCHCFLSLRLSSIAHDYHSVAPLTDTVSACTVLAPSR